MSALYYIEPSEEGGSPFGGDVLLDAVSYLKERGYSVAMSSEDVVVRSRASEWILQTGPTRCLRDSLLTEAVLAQTSDPSPLDALIRHHLDQLDAKDELLIIDPFFFPDSYDPTYLTRLEEIFSDALRSVNHLRIVVGTERNPILETKFLDMVQGVRPLITTVVTTSPDFHDRFVIADGSRGVFIGTSLNGIGRKYAIMDYMSDFDAKEIHLVYTQNT